MYRCWKRQGGLSEGSATFHVTHVARGTLQTYPGLVKSLWFDKDYRVCNRLSGYSGYSDIHKKLSVRIENRQYSEKSISAINRFTFLHSEALRYSSSVSTIRPLLEYLLFFLVSQ